MDGELDRTDRKLRRAMLVIALAGAGVAGYLTWVHFADLEPLCVAGSQCEKVQTSEYSEVAGVSVALIGLLGYVAIAVALIVLRGEAGLMVPALLAYVGFAFSAYLTWAEIFEIEAICQWCVGSFVLISALAVLATIRVVRGGGSASPPV